MLTGRNLERKNLNHYYDREGSQIVVLYGQRYIGKSSLINEFVADKDHYFYAARICSEREQLYQWGMQLGREGVKTSQFPTFAEVFDSLPYSGRGKQVIVIDEFSRIVKNSDTFMPELIRFIHSQWSKRQVLVLLVSSSVGWVENQMVEAIGESAYELSGLMKIRELPFRELVAYFPGFTMEQCIETYAVLGGFPGLWQMFDDRISVRENICRTLLNPGSILYNEPQRLLEDSLRETSVYGTILSSIAEGNYKLNDLYEKTDFSRAKISVYLKNLIELELVEKVFSYDTAGKANTQKGIYRIQNHILHFYFYFIYSNLSERETSSPSLFYKQYVGPAFKSYVGGYFKQICAQRLDERNKTGRLPFKYTKSGEWVGKMGNIDLVAQNNENETLLVLCNWDRPMMTYEDYEKLLICARKARISTDFIFLCSASRFDEKLHLEAKVKNNLQLIPASEL